MLKMSHWGSVWRIILAIKSDILENNGLQSVPLTVYCQKESIPTVPLWALMHELLRATSILVSTSKKD